MSLETESYSLSTSTNCSSASTPRFKQKKKTRRRFEFDSFKVLKTALDRHLKEKGCTCSVTRDRQFSSLKQILTV